MSAGPRGGELPAALVEPRPQPGDRRHTGEAFELVLDPVVPQLGRDVTEEPGESVQKFVENWELLARVSGLSVSYMQEEVFGRRRREREGGGARGGQ